MESTRAPESAGTAVKRSVAVLVIGGPLLRVVEHFVGLAQFLEILFGHFVARVLIRVELYGEPAIGLLDLLLRRAFFESENGVIIAFGHGGQAAGRLETTTVAGRNSRSRSL